MHVGAVPYLGMLGRSDRVDPELLWRTEGWEYGPLPEGRLGTPGREGREGGGGPPAADEGTEGFGGLYESESSTNTGGGSGVCTVGVISCDTNSIIHHVYCRLFHHPLTSTSTIVPLTPTHTAHPHHPHHTTPHSLVLVETSDISVSASLQVWYMRIISSLLCAAWVLSSISWSWLPAA